MHEALFWEKEGDKVRCRLCPHLCLIAEGRAGTCKVRTNVGGRLIALTYGKVSSIGLDPVEKKPFFHFKPGKTMLSFGSVGCNLGCLHCQNYAISQAGPSSFFLRDVPPEKVPELVRNYDGQGVAWTYNEPTMWTEFVIDSGRLCKDHGFFTGFVTNGYINEGPLRELKGIVDAINIDVKGFNEEFYKKICKAKLQPVLDTVRTAKELGMHVELTYLVITNKNDGADEVGRFCEWAMSIDPGMPIHFSRFHPDYRMMDVPPTPSATMERAYDIAKGRGLKFVYVGNMPSDHESTYCPDCGSLAIKRSGFSIRMVGVRDGKCSKCGASLGLVL
ncbi:MAG: AmmeMemoRadiSam system radical SAM enzyme [Methanomassiliicoccales archaeon]|nr:MAG: AmmeMemoRadiSam system radical SAM enzyme [Methanomassiliicoccales archaeon]